MRLVKLKLSQICFWENLVGRKGISVIPLVLCALLFLPLMTKAQDYSGGDGTQGNPYKISTADDLVELSTAVANGNSYAGAYFELQNDIDMSSVENFTPIGSARYAIRELSKNGYGITIESFTNAQTQQNGVYEARTPFSGNFNGNNYTISNLTISYQADASKDKEFTFNNSGAYVHSAGMIGLFGYIKDGNVNNLMLDGANISSTFVDSCGMNYFTGGIAGYVAGGSITDCGVYNSSISGDYFVGIVAGGLGNGQNTVGSYQFNATTGAKANGYITYTKTANVVEDEDGNQTISNLDELITIEGNTVNGIAYIGGVSADNISNVTNSTLINNVVASNNDPGFYGDTYNWDATKTYVGDIVGDNTDYGTGNVFIDNLGKVTRFTMKLFVNSYNFVGTTANGQSLGLLLDNKNLINGKHHDISVPVWNEDEGQWSTSEYLKAWNPMTRGKGYLVYVWDETNEQYTGKASEKIEDAQETYLTMPVDDNFSPVTLTPSSKWYAFANPYGDPLRINSDLNFSYNNGTTLQNTNISGVYVYRAAKYNAGESEGYLDFITRMNGSAQNTVIAGEGFLMYFDKISRTTINSITFKGRKNAKSGDEILHAPEITISVLTDDITRKIYANINEQASNNFIGGEDVPVLLNYTDRFVEPYFSTDDANLVYNSFNSLPYECSINFHAEKTSNAVLSVENIPDTIAVSIIDLATNEETVLDSVNNFKFTAEEGENAGKYKIKFVSKKSSLAEVSEADVDIFNNNKNIMISGQNLKDVTVINALGQTVYAKNISGSSYSFELNSQAGVYIVRVNTLNGQKVSKIVVE